MPIGGSKVGFLGAGVSSENYFGNGELGSCQFGASGITQTGDTVAIDTVLTTGSEAGGPGSSSYGGDVPYSSACYETTVLNTSGTYDGDMWVGQFTSLTIDASVTLTTDRACRGMFIYVDGNVTINGALSMSSRGGHADPTASGGSDASAVSATGLRLPLLTASGSDTLTAADFAGGGNAVVTAVANQDGITSNGTIFTMKQVGGTGGAGTCPGGVNGGQAGTTGGAQISTGGGGAGSGQCSNCCNGDGGDGGAFSGGSGGGGARHASGTAGGDYGGAGGTGNAGASGEDIGGGGGNPGGPGYGISAATSGVGGIIWLIAKGTVTLGASGSIQAYSPSQAGASYYGKSTAGGGAIFVLHGDTLTNGGTISAAASSAGSALHQGGGGGAGGTHTASIDA